MMEGEFIFVFKILCVVESGVRFVYVICRSMMHDGKRKKNIDCNVEICMML